MLQKCDICSNFLNNYSKTVDTEKSFDYNFNQGSDKRGFIPMFIPETIC